MWVLFFNFILLLVSGLNLFPMRNLINFILKQYFFFLFLLLEVIAISLLVQNHFYQRSYFVHSANFIAARSFGITDGITRYFNLQEHNRLLMEENTLLRQQNTNSFLATDRQIFTYLDTLYQRKYTYINARVISNTLQHRNNYLTLNKGRMHGIEPDMGVITHNGVIGVVRDVSANFSTVISLLHSDMSISAKLQKNNHLGSILWEGYNYRKVTMRYIPPHVELEKGDTIITSGFSQIFPEGIPIGIITDFEIRRGDNFFTIDVELLRDFNNLEHVHVVKNLFREEQKQLEQHIR